MSNDVNLVETQQFLDRLVRRGTEDRGEGSVVAAPGARAVAWAVKVKSHVSYNVYRVKAVVIGDAGSIPSEIGGEVEAVNLAESFLNEGTLSAGAYAMMVRVGDRNVFHAKP